MRPGENLRFSRRVNSRLISPNALARDRTRFNGFIVAAVGFIRWLL